MFLETLVHSGLAEEDRFGTPDPDPSDRWKQPEKFNSPLRLLGTGLFAVRLERFNDECSHRLDRTSRSDTLQPYQNIKMRLHNDNHASLLPGGTNKRLRWTGYHYRFDSSLQLGNVYHQCQTHWTHSVYECAFMNGLRFFHMAQLSTFQSE